MLTEAMFSIQDDQTQEMIVDICLSQLFKTVETYMLALNADIMLLNNSLVQDQLQLTVQNPLVANIMSKIDIVGSFIRMIFRVFEKVTQRQNYSRSYHTFVQSPHLASIFVRVFGIGIQIPNSPNNNSVINITGL